MNHLPLAAQAYQHLLKEILSGKRKEGERISEESIAAEFGISRTPAREALMRLSADGLVERTARKGCRILRVDRALQRELFECRAMIEVMALRMGFKAISPETLQETEAAVLAARNDPEASLEADERLHELILESCSNRVLADTARRLRNQCRAFRAIRALGTEDEAPYHERLAIIRAIQTGNLEEAAQLLSAHILQGASTPS